MSNHLKFTLGLILTTLFGNGQSNSLVFDNLPSEVCDGKESLFKIVEDEDHPCANFSSIEWFIRDDQTSVWGSSQHQGKQFPFTPNFGTNSRTFDIKAEITCVVQDGVDEDGKPKWINQTFRSPVRNIKVVHPDFFQLELVQNPSCDANSYEFRLRDPSGTLNDNNLDNISWTVPNDWSFSPGAPTSTLVVNTNGNNQGKRKVKVKYEAIATKIINGTPESKKCIDSREIEAEFDISACIAQINYPPQVANNPSSHSGNQTTFGATVLAADHYNFASAGSHTISPGFDFTSGTNSTLNLFIEECSCTSQWHDPSLVGDASVNITNPWIGASNKKGDYKVFKTDETAVDVKKNNITLYPNPFESQITISNLTQNKDIQVSVYGIDQKLILHQNGKSNGSGTYRLQLDGLPPGIYFLHINTKEQNLISSKIIKF
jgi:hypothetical protein